jgi:prepilin-type N-terminal cleavage/methylation domain-containing protein
VSKLPPISTARSGFTLLELMVVIVIVGILMGALLTSGGSLFRNSKVKETSVRMDTLATMVGSFRQIEGMFPNDRLPTGVNNGAMNSNSEALFLELFAEKYSGQRPDQDWLVNTDGDTTSKSLTILPARELFEICDAWNNPIVYFESLHYGTVAQVMAGTDDMLEEQTVEAVKNERTGAYQQPNGFQLISAGEDGTFGTEDDIVRP